MADPRTDDNYWLYWQKHEEYKTGTEDEKHWLACDFNYHNTVREGGTGWIQPDGKFHGCLFGMHCIIIIVFCGMTEAEAELKGWIKVCGARNMAFILHDMNPKIPKPTRAQRSVLNKLGYADSLTADM